MALGDGVRRNVAHITAEERHRLRDAFILIDTTKFYPDGVSFWNKQEDIHKNAHAAGQNVHGGPAFLPWHRELVNRLETLLREVDPAVSLHYWDWTEDPRMASDGRGGTIDIFAPDFMGNAEGDAGQPLADFESTEPGHTHIWREVGFGQPAPSDTFIPDDAEIVTAGDEGPETSQFINLRFALEGNAHNTAHGYIGGTLGFAHFSFHDPFVFLLHSEVDRLLAAWQRAPGQIYRLDPNRVYGDESNHPAIAGWLEPWAGDAGTGETPLRPWAPPDNQQVAKTAKDPTVVHPPLFDTATQDGWRWCHKCQGLFFGAGEELGACPGGGEHERANSAEYCLAFGAAPPIGQGGWRWCGKCQALAFGLASTPGACPAGDRHDHAGSADYQLVANAAAAPGQHGWRWCRKCQALAFGGSATAGPCPAGGLHDHAGSADYALTVKAPNIRDTNWRWCRKCQLLAYAGSATPAGCPAGGTHDHSGSADYSLVNNWPSFPGRHGFRRCRKCQSLASASAGTTGACPAGAAHDYTGSPNFCLVVDVAGAPGQHHWRQCTKCRSLAFAGLSTPGACAGGGQHDHTGSADHAVMVT